MKRPKLRYPSSFSGVHAFVLVLIFLGIPLPLVTLIPCERCMSGVAWAKMALDSEK